MVGPAVGRAIGPAVGRAIGPAVGGATGTSVGGVLGAEVGEALGAELGGVDGPAEFATLDSTPRIGLSIITHRVGLLHRDDDAGPGGGPSSSGIACTDDHTNRTRCGGTEYGGLLVIKQTPKDTKCLPY